LHNKGNRNYLIPRTARVSWYTHRHLHSLKHRCFLHGLCAQLSAKSTKSFITHGVVPDINWRDSTCRQFFFGIKMFPRYINYAVILWPSTVQVWNKERGTIAENAYGKQEKKTRDTWGDVRRLQEHALTIMKQMYISHNIKQMSHQFYTV